MECPEYSLRAIVCASVLANNLVPTTIEAEYSGSMLMFN